jgi:RimJ/RimL family protein N-acetyltransferase
LIGPVYGQTKLVEAFVAANIPGETGFGNCKAIGFGTPLVAGVVYHSWNPEGRVIELSSASTTRKWVSRANLKVIFGYPFDELDCQLCVARISEHNARARRIWRALGATEYPIPRFYGRDEAMIIATLPVEAWRAFERKM